MYSQKDGIVRVHVDEGPRAGADFEIVSREKDDFDPGWKSAYGKGAGVIVYIAEGTSEPKLSFDCSSAREVAAKVVSAAVYESNGKAVKAKCTVHHTFRRNGQTLSYRFEECKLSGGGGYASDDSGVKSKLEFQMTRVKMSVNSGPYTLVT